MPRFVARAKLDHQPSAQSDVRFALRATLLPSYPTRPLDAAGVVMNAVLAPKSAEICYGPGHIFADGYETTP